MKRAAVFQSLCSFGRASLTNLMPALSAMGVQVCPVPTAVLSTHLGYPNPARQDMTGQCQATVAHWTRLGLTFDAVLTGYLASPEQASIAAGCAHRQLAPGGLLVVDPVLGDGGRLYRSVTPELLEAVKALSEKAGLITPNLTEAAALLGLAPSDRPRDVQEAREWLLRLGQGTRSVILTGWEQDGAMGALLWSKEAGVETVLAPQAEVRPHGIGDLFSALTLGGLLQGETLRPAAERACRFCARAAQALVQAGTPEPEGLPFEPLLRTL